MIWIPSLHLALTGSQFICSLPRKRCLLQVKFHVSRLRAKAHSWASTGCGEGLTFACEEEGDPEVPLLLPKKCSISYKLSHSIMEPISLAWSTKGASGGKTRPQLRVCSTWWMPVFHAICVVLNEPTEREQSVILLLPGEEEWGKTLACSVVQLGLVKSSYQTDCDDRGVYVQVRPTLYMFREQKL